MNLGTLKNVLANLALKKPTLYERNDKGANLSLAIGGVALADSHNRCFLGKASTHTLTFDLGASLGVHALHKPTDVGFVNLHRTRELLERPAFHGRSDAMQHEPRRLLRYVESAGNLARRDTVLRVSNKPDRRQPLVIAQGRLFKNRAHLGRELPLAIVAAPGATGGDKMDVRGTATHTGARHTIGPAHGDDKIVRLLRVRVSADRLGERFGISDFGGHTPFYRKQACESSI